MPTNLQTITITTLGEFTSQIELALSRSNGCVWYRGIGDSSQKLIPSLYRHPSTKDSAGLIKLESDILDRFTHRSVPYLSKSPQNSWEYLFLMQHFGVPTRLLDWTENPYIAFYFALTSAFFDYRNAPPCYHNDAAVWILDPTAWNRKVLSHISFQGSILSPRDEQLKGYAPSTDITLMNTDPLAL